MPQRQNAITLHTLWFQGHIGLPVRQLTVSALADERARAAAGRRLPGPDPGSLPRGCGSQRRTSACRRAVAARRPAGSPAETAMVCQGPDGAAIRACSPCGATRRRSARPGLAAASSRNPDLSGSGGCWPQTGTDAPPSRSSDPARPETVTQRFDTAFDPSGYGLASTWGGPRSVSRLGPDCTRGARERRASARGRANSGPPPGSSVSGARRGLGASRPASDRRAASPPRGLRGACRPPVGPRGAAPAAWLRHRVAASRT